MLKKRVIFTLLFDSTHFMLSRNFRLQRVGTIDWLQKNYNFSKIAFSIDELVVLDVTRQARDEANFCDHLKQLTKGCFVPIAAGGGVRTLEQARRLLRSGADKIIVNTLAHDHPAIVNSIALEFGRQCVVVSVDVKRLEGQYRVFVENGQTLIRPALTEYIEYLNTLQIGEIYLNSIDRDGTGQGYDLTMLASVPRHLNVPLIMAGGVGNSTHLAEGLSEPQIDATATAHLFNFVGDGLSKARTELIAKGYQLPIWDIALADSIAGKAAV